MPPQTPLQLEVAQGVLILPVKCNRKSLNEASRKTSLKKQGRLPVASAWVPFLAVTVLGHWCSSYTDSGHLV